MTLRSSLVASLAAAFLAIGPEALAAERPSAREVQAKELEAARAVEINNVPAPVFGEGKLYNYHFLNVRFVLSSGQNVVKMRDEAHILRDAVIRAVHRTSVARLETHDVLEEQIVVELLKKTAEETFGAGVVSTVDITFSEPMRQRDGRLGSVRSARAVAP